LPLDDTYPYAVAFITIPDPTDEDPHRKQAIGTGFIVVCRSQGEPGSRPFRYIVTARHNVEDLDETFARVRSSKEDDPPHDKAVPKWEYHDDPDVDVAVAPFIPDTSMNMASIPFTAFTNAVEYPYLRPMLGDRVHFLGLLSSHPPMGERNIPMVRTGAIGALYERDIIVENGKHFPVAHLIDCRSHRGFSGSPCFYQRDDTIPPPGQGVEGTFDQRGTMTMALGLLSGHFNLAEQLSHINTGEPITRLQSTVPSGVGIVIPAYLIAEVIMRLNEEDEAGRPKSRRAVPLPATLDSARNDESEYDRFDRAVTHLARTPKPARTENKRTEKEGE
jgi:hypothetical protein